MTPKGFLTLDQVSANTGIPVTTLRNYRRTDAGPKSFKIAGRVVYAPDSVDEWLTSQMTATVRGGQ